MGERIEFTYRVAGATITSPDYLYKNDHVDMIETVKWASGGDSVVYHYEYDDSDRLVEVYTLIDNNNRYGESFSYSDDKLSSITNPEGARYDIEGQIISSRNQGYYGND